MEEMVARREHVACRVQRLSSLEVLRRVGCTSRVRRGVREGQHADHALGRVVENRTRDCPVVVVLGRLQRLRQQESAAIHALQKQDQHLHGHIQAGAQTEGRVGLEPNKVVLVGCEVPDQHNPAGTRTKNILSEQNQDIRATHVKPKKERDELI